jgi:hypothetical protein
LRHEALFSIINGKKYGTLVTAHIVYDLNMIWHFLALQE